MTLASGLDVGAHAGAHPLARYRTEFPIFRDKVYLNTCSLGALGDRTRRRLEEFLDLWQARGASAWYDVWWAALGELRERYARIIRASADEIALAPSISVAISTVAEALDYRARPRVVVTDRKSTRLNSSHPSISYAVFCLKKKKTLTPASDITTC